MTKRKRTYFTPLDKQKICEAIDSCGISPTTYAKKNNLNQRSVRNIYAAYLNKAAPTSLAVMPLVNERPQVEMNDNSMIPVDAEEDDWFFLSHKQPEPPKHSYEQVRLQKVDTVGTRLPMPKADLNGGFDFSCLTYLEAFLNQRRNL